MADDKTTSEIVLPIATTERGDIKAITFNPETGASEGRTFIKALEGQPLMADHVTHLHDVEGTPFLEAKTTSLLPEPTTIGSEPQGEGHKGPARVNSEAYQGGWERIWGNREPGEA